MGIVLGASVLATLPQTAGKVSRLGEPASTDRGTKSINAAAQLPYNLVVRNGLTDLGHVALPCGSSFTATTSIGIGVVINRMTQTEEDESAALARILGTSKPSYRPLTGARIRSVLLGVTPPNHVSFR
jgi:hypothetical protein